MDNALAEPTFVTWTHNGKEYTQISVPSKRELLKDYARRYQCKTFVETGTCDGGTLVAMIPLFDKLYSIELDDEVYRIAAERFLATPSVTVIHGDSASELPKLLPLVESPALFWLDAHSEDYIGPVTSELGSIFASGVTGVVLIDDMDYIPDALPEHADWIPDGRAYGIVRLIHK